MNACKKILLTTSAAPSQSPFFTSEKRPPLGIGFLISVLRGAGHEVFFIDNYLSPTDFLETDYLHFNQIDFVGIYANTICYRDTLRMLYKLEYLRRIGNWKGEIIVGGPHTTVALNTIPEFVDHVVQGEGEYAILDIVEGKASQRVVNYPRIQNLDELPMPAWDYFVTLPYNWHVEWFPEDPVFTMNTSRGCPSQCTFCSVGSIWGKNYTYFSAERIVSDIEYLVEHHGAKGIYFREDNFTLNKSRLSQYCNLLLEKGIKIPWACETRVSSLDRESLELMYRAGVCGFYFGVESGSQRMLDFFNKGITVEQTRKAFALCHEYGIKTAASVIVGAPSETDEDLQQTLTLLDDIKPTTKWFNVFVGIPDSPLYQYSINNNLFELIDDRGLVYLKGHNERANKYYGKNSSAQIPAICHQENRGFKPKISVLMSVYNGEKYLETAIQSILKQTFQDFEFIIIDDASTDSTPDILIKLSDPRVKILRNHKNLGLTKSLNIGTREAQGEYIARMDADDISLPHRFESQIRYLDMHTDYALVGSLAYQIDETGQYQFIPKLQTDDHLIRKHLIQSNNFVHGSVMIRRNVLLSMGGYDERFKYANDYNLWLRIIERHKVANLPEPLYCWRSYSTQISSAKKQDQDSCAEMARQEAMERATKTGRADIALNVIAIISAHNEGDVIYHVIGDLIHQGVSVYLLDHHSTDNTVEEAAKWLGNGLLHIETFPDDSNYSEENKSQYIWRDILKRKSELASWLDADWFIHADADEFRESPWPGLTLKEAINVVDHLGYNAIDFELLNFRPVNNSFIPGQDVREFLKYYEGAEDFNTHQVKAWKNLHVKIDLVTSGGHDVTFNGRKVFPIQFILRHYPIRSQQHGLLKIFQQRKNRFSPEERAMGWHIQYDEVQDENHNFIYDPNQLTYYDVDQIRTQLLTDKSCHLNVTKGLENENFDSRTPSKLYAAGYDTDKSPKYLINYERYFNSIADNPIRLLELGVFKGGSLYLWRDYFKKGIIVGLDANEVNINDPSGRIRFYKGLQQDVTLLDRISKECAPEGFDIIIDDASHIGELSRLSFWHLFKNYLKPGGIYVIEDWGTGYWDSFPDGKAYTQGENHLAGMVGFIKELIDECGMADITHPRHGHSPQKESIFERMEVCHGQVFIVKALERSLCNVVKREGFLHGAYDSGSPTNLHHHAIRLFQQGNLSESIETMHRALNADSNNAEIYNDLGSLYYQKGEEDKATALFRRAIELDSTLMEARKNLADLHRAAERFAEAEAIYKEILDRNPNDPDALAALQSMSKGEFSPASPKSCPVCGSIAYHSVTKLDHPYYLCTNCESVFTSSIDPKALITENQGNDDRHRTEFDNKRLSYLTRGSSLHVQKILDFGCGKGEYGRFLASKGIQCLDIDQDTELQLEDIPSESIDGINMVEVIAHLYDPVAYLREFYRVLKPGGRLFVESSYWNGQDLETWEYLSPAIGHCLVHSERSLVLLAREFNLSIRRINANCYLFEKPASVKSARLTNQSSFQTNEETGATPDSPKCDESRHSSKYKDAAPLVSIIIPVFNQIKFTSSCLEALFQNTPLERIYEVIIVDNASSDGTREFLKEARKRYPKLKTLTNKENLLFAKACNQGADIAGGDYLVFLNNDTEPLPGWLDPPLERFESDESIGIIGIKLLYPDRTVQHCGIQFYRSVNPTYVIWPLHRYLHSSSDDPRVNVPQDVHAVTGACLFIRNELFRRIGGFEERYGMYFEDTDLCFKARKAGKRVFYEPGSVAIHHEGKSSPSREIIDEFNEKAAHMFYKLWDKDLYVYELETLIEKEEGKYVYLTDNFWPEIDGEEIVRMHHLLSSFPPCYVHFGGSGDALLLLSTFYDRDPEQTIVSISNSKGMMKSFFDAFPKLKKVYFIPFPENSQWHFISRRFFKTSDTCLGLGATPTTKADYREWSADLDIFKAYGIQKRPLWGADFRKNRLEQRQVTIQPRGSLKGMVGSKRNALDAKDWQRLISYLEQKGVKPIIIGTPDEAAEYPCLGNALDRRSYSFDEQMQLIAASDFFIGADSWGKTFSALVGIPTFVFHAMRGEDLKNWKDASDYVFLDPWEEITVVKDLKAFRESFTIAWQDRFPSAEDLKIRWEGSQFVHHSLALVNRELCLGLIEKGCEVSIMPYEKDQFTPKEEPRFKPIAKRTKRPLSGPADVHVRHQWPPDFTPPIEGHWVIIQPWEFGSIPQEWVRHMVASVDEIWVPSHYVRDCFIRSGVPSERVFVVPNGVNIDLFNPYNPPYRLNTKKAFKFLFVGGTIPRKGIDILLDVYTKTFSSGDDVCLVIKDMGGQTFYKGQTAKDMITRLQADPGCPEIEYIEQTLGSQEIAGLYCACDCLVHPYRGEGFGLPIAEAMASGRPVIVTGLGAALDFCHEQTSYLIPAKEMRLKEKRIGELATVDFPWLAEPEKEGLATLMKHVVTHREETAAKGIQAASFIRENFTWDHAADAVIKRVSELRRKPIVRHSPAMDPIRQDRHHYKERTSIVILTSNRLDYTKKCIESIRMHTPEPYEIIFVDNGSNDGTVEWLRNLVKETSGLKLIENEKDLGLSKGCNQGIKAASGDYILLLHNDVVVTEGWLSGMIDQMKIYPDINTGMVGPMTNSTSGTQLVEGIPYGNDLKGMHAYAVDFRQARAGKTLQEWCLAAFCVLIRRKILDIIGGFDENYECGTYAFDDLCLRSHLAGYRHIIARDVFVHHYGGFTPAGNTVDYGTSLKSDREHFVLKWSRFVTPSAVSTTDKGYSLIQKITEKEGIEELLHWGEECFSRGEIKRALRIFERVLWLKPKNAQALSNLGVIQWQLGETTSAVNIFQKALFLNPYDTDALANLVQAVEEIKRADLVQNNLIDLLRQSQPANPDFRRLIDGRQVNV